MTTHTGPDATAANRVDLPFPAMPSQLVSRRSVLLGGAAGVALIGAPGTPAVAVPLGANRARYLTRTRLATLRGIVDRVVPADDGFPGAAEAGSHVAIDALLGAFRTNPPRIYAGGPFSDRGGADRNDFKRFQRLDRYERTAWQLRIHGSRGKQRLQRNGRYPGYQKIYDRGLDAMERHAPGFAVLPGPARDLAMQNATDPRITAMIGLAVAHTFETFWGAPEYGGNRNQLGWKVIGFDGDRQPRGYTDDEVLNPPVTPIPPLDITAAVERFGPAMAMATSEAMYGPLAATTTGHAHLTREVRGWMRHYDRALEALRQLSSTRLAKGDDR